jgi:hypothetical protein
MLARTPLQFPINILERALELAQDFRPPVIKSHYSTMSMFAVAPAWTQDSFASPGLGHGIAGRMLMAYAMQAAQLLSTNVAPTREGRTLEEYVSSTPLQYNFSC